MWVQREPYPTQVEPVGIVASTDSRVIVAAFVRMELTGVIKFFKAGVVYFEQFRLAAFLREFGTAQAVVTVMAVIEALAVVEYGKKPDDIDIGARTRGKQEPVEFDLVPMLYAVNVRLIRTIRESMFHYGSKVNHNQAP